MKKIKTFAKFFENSTNTVDVYNLSHEQIYYLIEFLESSLEMFDSADFEHYEGQTGLDITTLMDMYVGYGRYSVGDYSETTKIKDQYCKLNNVTWETIISEHSDSF